MALIVCRCFIHCYSNVLSAYITGSTLWTSLFLCMEMNAGFVPVVLNTICIIYYYIICLWHNITILSDWQVNCTEKWQTVELFFIRQSFKLHLNWFVRKHVIFYWSIFDNKSIKSLYYRSLFNGCYTHIVHVYFFFSPSYQWLSS